MFTLNGVRRSLEVMSVNDMPIEESSGTSMNTPKTSTKGRQNPQATSAWRRLRAPLRPPSAPR